MRGQRVPEGAPGLVRIPVAAGGRVVPRQLRQRVVEDQAMHRAHEAQGQGGRSRLLLEAAEHIAHRSTCFQVVGGGLEQRRVQG